jgi:hypothetical protein
MNFVVSTQCAKECYALFVKLCILFCELKIAQQQYHCSFVLSVLSALLAGDNHTLHGCAPYVALCTLQCISYAYTA